MAADLRHAAGQATYEVREVLGGDPAADLGVLYRCADYANAVEFALEFLERRDPHREGKVGGLQVVKGENGTRETVWTYVHSAQETRLENPIHRWGFDVTRHWQGPATPVRPNTSLRRRVYRRA
ncbi:MAG TPA: hypothetical protein VE693_09270 [Gaiellaceae bacterium]|jgi:hypothetical protein|nr:hypothetical protein [Gaiellaceae bacterium]